MKKVNQKSYLMMNKSKVIGFDFSINKPAVCISDAVSFEFYSWPYGVSDTALSALKDGGVNLYPREKETRKGKDSSEKVRLELESSEKLSWLIIDTLKDYLTVDTVVAFEGLSYASSGNTAFQLSNYKFDLMKQLLNFIPLSNIYNYAPISLKKAAGCSEKGKNKNDMIQAFIDESKNNSLKNKIAEDKVRFLKRGGKNWIDHLDDLVDAYWALQTYYEKEFFN